MVLMKEETVIEKMTPKEAISYIENYGWSTTKLGLERTRELLRSLSDPQKELKFVHVAGSNGKGSTCSMLASILKEAGYKTGLYISPYIEIFNERIQINGEYIDSERLAEITARVKAIADSMEDHPSQFELVTAIAIQYYYEEKCDIVVLEVGMGGALDSTNAIDAPEVAVITNIGLEHTEYLGSTLEEIAETKGGIIKTGANCVCYDGEPQVNETIKRICMERDVPFSLVDFNRVMPISSNLDGQSFSYNNGDQKEYKLALLGAHQLKNTAVVLEVIETLRSRGWTIGEDAVSRGLELVKWPARFEVLSTNPIFILDGGHNPQCAEALVEGIKEYLSHKEIIFLLGVLADKDYETILDLVIPYAKEFICVTPLSDRALPAAELAEFIKAKGSRATAAKTIPEGIMLAEETAEETGSAIIAFGSLYLAGAVRGEFRAPHRKFLRKQGKKNRDSLSPEEREIKSIEIVKNISTLSEFTKARNILSYSWTGGEVKLDYLEDIASAEGDSRCNILYPVCIDSENMIAVKPGEGEEAWRKGAYGIREPIPEKGEVINPEEIDMVICPLTAFDECCNRLGMGGGYYDRFLPKCTKAVKIGAAFMAQKTKEVPMEPHDIRLDMVVTESDIYRTKD